MKPLKNEKKKFSIKQRMAAFGFAARGIAQAVKTQHNLWIQLTIALLTVVLASWLSVNTTEWIFIVFAIGLVLTAEIFNSSIELLVDMVSPERNKNAGRVKDMAAGAVLIAALTAAVIGLVIFIPKLIQLL